MAKAIGNAMVWILALCILGIFLAAVTHSCTVDEIGSNYRFICGQAGYAKSVKVYNDSPIKFGEPPYDIYCVRGVGDDIEIVLAESLVISE